MEGYKNRIYNHDKMKSGRQENMKDKGNLRKGIPSLQSRGQWRLRNGGALCPKLKHALSQSDLASILAKLWGHTGACFDGQSQQPNCMLLACITRSKQRPSWRLEVMTEEGFSVIGGMTVKVKRWV